MGVGVFHGNIIAYLEKFTRPSIRRKTRYTTRVTPIVLLNLGVLIGSLSPLFTFARLFQMKEWRMDRLLEHVRREGFFVSLIGLTTGVIVGAYTLILIAGLSFIFTTGGGGPSLAIFLSFIDAIPWWIGAYAVLSLAKILFKRQRFPRWTTKALLIVSTTIFLTLLAAFQLHFFLIPFLPALQPAFLIVSWLAWKPVDHYMKRRLLRRAAAHRATFHNETVIGIVGSVGKTTTKELLHSVLTDFRPFTTPEHVNTELGVAAWLLKNVPANSKHPLLIVEMGAYKKGEITTLCTVTKPTIAVITALGSDHLALFGSEEAIIDANAEILNALPTNGHVFLLGDNTTTKSLRQRAHHPTTIVGSTDAEQIRDTDRGLTFEQSGTRFTVALHGRHNVGNTLLTIGVARHLGVTHERIRELLAGFRGTHHTFHLRKERGILILDDTYNVSPLSFRAVLDWAKERPERPRVLLSSGLLETGSHEQTFMRELGTTAKSCIERAIFTTASGTDAFAETFGPVEILKKNTPRIPDDALLLCVGRMSPTTIQRLLP